MPSFGLLMLAVFALHVGKVSQGRPVEDGHYERWTAYADSVQSGKRTPSLVTTAEMERSLIQLAKTEEVAAVAGSEVIVHIGSWIILPALAQLALIAWLAAPSSPSSTDS
jgi:hypothetical protein